MDIQLKLFTEMNLVNLLGFSPSNSSKASPLYPLILVPVQTGMAGQTGGAHMQGAEFQDSHAGSSERQGQARGRAWRVAPTPQTREVPVTDPALRLG